MSSSDSLGFFNKDAYCVLLIIQIDTAASDCRGEISCFGIIKKGGGALLVVHYN